MARLYRLFLFERISLTFGIFLDIPGTGDCCSVFIQVICKVFMLGFSLHVLFVLLFFGLYVLFIVINIRDNRFKNVVIFVIPWG